MIEKNGKNEGQDDLKRAVVTSMHHSLISCQLMSLHAYHSGHIPSIIVPSLLPHSASTATTRLPPTHCPIGSATWFT